MKKFAVALLVSAVSCAPALAAEAGSSYVNLDYSNFMLGSPANFGPNGNTPFNNTGAFRIGGGYNFTEQFAVEAGYSMIFNSSFISTSLPGSTGEETLKSNSYQLAGVGTLPINEAVEVFGKLGVAHNRVEHSCSGAVTCPTESMSRNSVMYGAGLKFNLSKSWGLRVQYEHYGTVTKASSVRFKFAATSFGAVYSF